MTSRIIHRSWTKRNFGMFAKLGCSCLLGGLLILGCSKDEASASKRPTPSNSVAMAAIPSELLAPSGCSPQSLALLMQMQEAIANGGNEGLSKATQLLRQFKQTFPQDRIVRLVAAIHLIRGHAWAKSRDLKNLRSDIDSLDIAESDPHITDLIRTQWKWWLFLVLLGSGKEVLLADDTTYQEWRRTLAESMLQLEVISCPGWSSFVWMANLMTLDVANASSVREAASRADQILAQIECTFLTMNNNAGPLWVTCELQRLRVDVLAKGRMYDEALSEARVSLAVSSLRSSGLNTAIEQTLRVMTLAGRTDTELQQLKLFLQFGPVGKDGKPETSDDIPNVLASCHRTSSPLQMATDTSPVDTEDPVANIRLAYLDLFAGRGLESIARFQKVIRSYPVPTKEQMALVLNGIGVAQAYVDGHPLDAEKFAVALLTQTDSVQAPSPVWRSEAKRFLELRDLQVKELFAFANCDQAIGISRSILNTCGDPARCRVLLDTVFSGCNAQGRDVLDCTEPFSQGLTSIPARIYYAQMIAKFKLQLNDVPGAMAELENLGPLLAVTEPDPEIVFLKSSCLIRAERREEALQGLRSIEHRLDVSDDLKGRIQLLISAIHLQEGRMVEVREILRRMIDELPGSSSASRASEILKNL